MARYLRIALSSSPSIGCIPEFEPFNRLTHSVARSRLTSSLRMSTASLQRSPWRYIIRNSRWSLIPCLPVLAASRNDLISVWSRKSLGRCGSVTELLTLSDLATSSIGAVSLGLCGVAEGYSQQNCDNVERPRTIADHGRHRDCPGRC